MNIYFKRLRKQLPHRYAAIISGRLDGVTVRQVRGVFNGEIKNPKMVDQVVKAAIKVRNENENHNRHIQRRIRKALKRAA